MVAFTLAHFLCILACPSYAQFPAFRSTSTNLCVVDPSTPMADSKLLSKKDTMIGYKLIENECPFPRDKISAATPLTWRLSEGLARALSVDPGCEYVHVLAMGSLPLNCVKTHYSGILGVFPNLVINCHGASGDGKSVPLWFDTQVMHYLRKSILKKLNEEWHTRNTNYKAWCEDGKKDPAVPEPGPKPTWEQLYDAGSLIGLGIQLQANDGIAFLIKHEGKQWIRNLLAGGPSGSMDDLNAILEHAFFKNGPANKDSRFRVENPHLVVFILTHMEELVALLEETRDSAKDSVAGLSRFLYCHFPPKCNKILPEASEEEIKDLIEQDEEFFNDVVFDDAVLSIVNPLLLLGRLYELGKEREDEKDEKQMFSTLSGLHTMKWDTGARGRFAEKFNESSAKITASFSKLRTRIDASSLSKDKTRPLQLVPTCELMESVLRYILQSANKSVDASHYTPEKLVETIAKVDVEALLATFAPKDIPSLITKVGVDAADALSTWFAKQGLMLANMTALLEKFRTRRKELARFDKARPPVMLALAQEQQIDWPCEVATFYIELCMHAFDWEELMTNPDHSEADIANAKFKIMLLSLCGLVRIEDGAWRLMRFHEGAPALARATTRLEKIDENTEVEQVAEAAPKGLAAATTGLNAAASDALLEVLVKYGKGMEVPTAELEALEDPFPTTTVASQAHAEVAREDAQKRLHHEPAEDGGSTRHVKARIVTELTEDTIADYAAVITPALKFLCLSKQQSFNKGDLKKKFATTLAALEQDKAIGLVFEWFKLAGLGRCPRQHGSVTLLRPESEGDVTAVTKDLANLLNLKEEAVNAAVHTREVSNEFNLESFRRAWALAGGGQVPAMVPAVAQGDAGVGGGNPEVAAEDLHD
jgi:hypothetical protein